MKPVHFSEHNRILNPPTSRTYSANVGSIAMLPVWTDDEQCVSCWKLSFWERLRALFFGRVWVAVLSGGTQPPIRVGVERRYFEEAK